jgi:membrane protease YdiL (CAAX protease family)
LLLLGVAELLSLSALAWPVVRGVPWRQVRQDIGLTWGRQPALEPMVGVACYAMTIPLLAAGLALTLLLLRLQRWQQGDVNPEDYFGPSRQTHPIIEFLAGGNWRQRLEVLFLASGVAPVVEEIMFRGVLYRHLREASHGGGFGWSVLLSALLVSLIFAAIHPQGLAYVPPLLALAFGFNLAREWRGTLVPGMVAHAVNNGLAMLLFMLAWSGGA